MPRKGWLIRDEKYTPEKVVALAERDGFFHRFPPAAWMALNRGTERADKWWLSPSGATSCPRLHLLKATEDYWLDPEKTWASLVGTAMHNHFETGDAHEEMKLRMDLRVPVDMPDGGVKIVDFPIQGTLDKYDPRYRRLTDYKSTSDFFIPGPGGKRVAKELPESRHITQVNIYRLLLEEHGHPVETAQIFYFKTDKSAARKGVTVPLWALEDTYQTAVAAAEALAWAREHQRLPVCTCQWKNTGMDRDLCAVVADDEWRGLAVE